MKAPLLLVFAWAMGACGDSESSSTGQRGAESCEPAPAVPEAAAAWQEFLDWHAANAAACGEDERWPSYECVTRYQDPRTIPAFTACMMADGCNSISNEDECSGAGITLDAAALDWAENVCFPRSDSCGFLDDYCAAISPGANPEWRCAIVDCVEQEDCAAVVSCIQAARDQFLGCTDD